MKKILLVDDDQYIRTIASIGLEDAEDWQVIEAGSGAEGLEIAGKQHPDLILLDMMMPGMDGVQTLAKLQEQEGTRDIPVIFMTAKAHRKEIEGYKSLGVVGVITKPFDPLTLVDDIVALVSI